MALANVKLEELPEFGRKLMMLAKENEIGSPIHWQPDFMKNNENLSNPRGEKISTVKL